MNRPALQWLWWCLAAALVAALVWRAVPDPEPPTKLVRAAQPWALPAAPSVEDLTAEAASIANSALWGRKPASGAVPEVVEDTRWAIGGAYVNDGVGTAVIRFAAKRPELLVRKGDSLPNGDVVVEVEIDRLCVMSGKKRECRPVVPVKPIGF